MFDNLKGMAGLAGMMKDLPRIKEKMQEVRDRLGDVRVEAETGGGAVTAVASGHFRIIEIRIDEAMLGSLVDAGNPDDRAMAQDLITGAINAALEKAKEAAEQEMGDAANELGLPLPPGGMGGLVS